MTVNRATWHRLVAMDNIPRFPCPHCAVGKLRPDGEVTLIEPKHSANWREQNPDLFEFIHVVNRWSLGLKCDEKDCGEIVNMIGDTEVVDAQVDTGTGQVTWGEEEALRVQSVFPAPPLFPISANVPFQVSEQLKLAFKLYWLDTSACVARLRTAVERLLDEQGVAKERLLTVGPNTGKMHRMNLQERIGSFAMASGASHADQLQGLRNIGNLGTHGGSDVDDDDLFDALDVLEFVLAGVYDSKTINAKATKLKNKKSQ